MVEVFGSKNEQVMPLVAKKLKVTCLNFCLLFIHICNIRFFFFFCFRKESFITCECHFYIEVYLQTLIKERTVLIEFM